MRKIPGISGRQREYVVQAFRRLRTRMRDGTTKLIKPLP